jgi:hypothetical protein
MLQGATAWAMTLCWLSLGGAAATFNPQDAARHTKMSATKVTKDAVAGLRRGRGRSVAGYQSCGCGIRCAAKVQRQLAGEVRAVPRDTRMPL